MKWETEVKDDIFFGAKIKKNKATQGQDILNDEAVRIPRK